MIVCPTLQLIDWNNVLCLWLLIEMKFYYCPLRINITFSMIWLMITVGNGRAHCGNHQSIVCRNCSILTCLIANLNVHLFRSTVVKCDLESSVTHLGWTFQCIGLHFDFVYGKICTQFYQYLHHILSCWRDGDLSLMWTKIDVL